VFTQKCVAGILIADVGPDGNALSDDAQVQIDVPDFALTECDFDLAEVGVAIQPVNILEKLAFANVALLLEAHGAGVDTVGKMTLPLRTDNIDISDLTLQHGHLNNPSRAVLLRVINVNDGMVFLSAKENHLPLKFSYR